MRARALLVALALACPAAAAAQNTAPDTDPLHRPFEEILDVQVRDGLVYYNALKSLRGNLDRYVLSLGSIPRAQLDGWSRERQMAYWINAYNALVLQTVISDYPIRGRSADYPASSIRQIPGAFESRTHRVGGRILTLDQIETEVLAGFDDPRVFLAIGRGAVGGGRLRSEAFSASRLEAQLAAVAAEALTRRQLVRFDRAAERVTMSPVFSWREAQFTAALADQAPAVFATRSPIERAVLALILPHLLQTERDFIMQNRFAMAFHDFDWRLNDLTGGGPGPAWN